MTLTQYQLILTWTNYAKTKSEENHPHQAVALRHRCKITRSWLDARANRLESRSQYNRDQSVSQIWLFQIVHLYFYPMIGLKPDIQATFSKLLSHTDNFPVECNSCRVRFQDCPSTLRHNWLCSVRWRTKTSSRTQKSRPQSRRPTKRKVLTLMFY